MALAGTVPPLCANEVAPAERVAGVKPLQPVTVTAPDAVSPAGSASVKAAADSATALGFCTVMMSCATPPAFTLTGLKATAMTAGWRTLTSSRVEVFGL